MRPEQACVLPVAWGQLVVPDAWGHKADDKDFRAETGLETCLCLEVKIMQPNVIFNTHKTVKALKSSGFDEKQAESVVETIDKAVNETVATKSDLALLGAEIVTLKETVKAEVANLETRMMRMLLLQTIVLVGLLIPVIVKLL